MKSNIYREIVDLKRFDGHTHPFNVHRTKEWMRLFVEAALERKLSGMIFTEHAPLPNFVRQDGHFQTMQECENYFKYAHELRDEYRGDIKIIVGLEGDYHPKFYDFSVKLLQEFPIEVFTGSLHLHVDFWDKELAEAEAGQECEFAFAKIMDLIDTELFDSLNHLDFFRLRLHRYDPAQYEEQFRQVFAKMVEKEMTLELNFSGLTRDYHDTHPAQTAWQISQEYPLLRVYGSDAHLPENLLNLG